MTGQHPEWRLSPGLVDYPAAVHEMEERARLIFDNCAPELVWLLEHPPLYTAGTSARHEHLLNADRFQVHTVRRGGQYTYHGPGQRVAYVMLDLRRRKQDVRLYVHALEQWLICVLNRFGIVGERRDGRVGIWVARSTEAGRSHEDKIAAIGVQIKRWVTLHGMALNVRPDLSHFDGIVPCGIRRHGVTSLWDLGVRVTMDEVDAVLKDAFAEVFGTGTPFVIASPTDTSSR